MITAPDETTAQQLRAIAVNELDLAKSQGRALVLSYPLQIVSPAYIAQRNANELALLQLLQNAKEENARLRSK